MNTLITGASSGIGEALAFECARSGDSLFLCGRNHDRLNEVAARCRELGALQVVATPLDIADATATGTWLRQSDSICALDRVFANAGVSTGEESEANVRKTFSINVGGCVNTVLPANRNLGLIAFPWPMRLATWWLSTLPHRANEMINHLLPKKVI